MIWLSRLRNILVFCFVLFSLVFLSLSGLSFAENSRITGQQGNMEANSNFSLSLPPASVDWGGPILSPLCLFHPMHLFTPELHQQVGIIRDMTNLIQTNT